MQVSALNSSSTSVATPTTSPPNSTLGYGDFLQLLMAQMKHQDPTSPTDSTQWVSQLATFSSVEQAVQSNAKLDQILQNTALTDAEALIGRSLTSADGAISGVVVAVSLTSNGLVATLDNGAVLPVTSNVTISS